MKSMSHRSGVSVLAVSACALAVMACGADALGQEPVGAKLPAPPVLAQVVTSGMDAPSVGRVSALGSGCRRDTTDVLYTGANKGFTIRFADYTLELDPSMAQSRMDRDCIISVEVLSPRGLRYAVTGLKYRGYAVLEEGVIARQQVDYTFVGVAEGGAPKRKNSELAGPWDDAFQFSDQLSASELSWSDCATDRTLLINTRLSLINASAKRQGYLSWSAVDADTSQLEITFDWQPCIDAP